VILSADFCRGMLRLAKQTQTTRLAICPTEKGPAPEGHALFAADDTLLFGRLIAGDPSKGPADYVGVLGTHPPKDYAKQAAPIPHRTFAPLLRRANCIVGIVGSEPYTSISVRDGEARFHGCSHHGEFIETLHLPGHPDIELKVHISNVFKAYSAFRPQQVLFGERAVVLVRGDHLQMVATSRAA
jgi:hypothetical protein